jgi:glucose/arabinose dehydrogenase
VIALCFAGAWLVQDPTPPPAADPRSEARYYRVETLALPEEVELEVGGLLARADGSLLVCTRRGEVWSIQDAFAEGSEARFVRFAQGLHEPLGLLELDGWIYVAQRGELSRMRDVDGDERMDELETVCDAWPLSGNYHEYNFGPALAPDGSLWITTNKPFGDEPFGRAKWRGFALRVAPDGTLQPMCAGLRSPAGIGAAPWGDLFYTDNQGEWCGASKLAHLEPGDFHGHPWGAFSCEDPLWTFAKPGEAPNGAPMPEVALSLPSFKLPAVWFPYDKMGRSPSGFVWDHNGGAFGPFTGQLFVGDQYQSSVMRVFLERVGKRWQGACFPFRRGLSSGVVRVAWDRRGGLLCGLTDRGWGSLGNRTHGLERLAWSGETPFEILAMRARSDGFELEFTAPVELVSGSEPSNYQLSSYTYLLHENYGSDEVDKQTLKVREARVSEDRRSVRLIVEGLREGYVHELACDVVRGDGHKGRLVHDKAYYTLIERPKD